MIIAALRHLGFGPDPSAMQHDSAIVHDGETGIGSLIEDLYPGAEFGSNRGNQLVIDSKEEK